MTLPGGGHWLRPRWQPHPRVRILVTDRLGSFSPSPWQGFNLGANCGDDPQRVEKARKQVHAVLGTRHSPHWLKQIHGTRIIAAGSDQQEADGVWTDQPERPCVVLTADCLPVLLAREDGTAVAAVHAGWRGLCAGVLERGVAQLAPEGEKVTAWIGPAISQAHYQVGGKVREAFLAHSPIAADAFVKDQEPDHWRLCLITLATQRLEAAGVTRTGSASICTFASVDRYYSFRREGNTGRFASLIWLTNMTF